MGVPGKKGTERVFEEIMAKDCPNLMKNTNLYIAEAQQTTKDKVKEIYTRTYYNKTVKKLLRDPASTKSDMYKGSLKRLTTYSHQNPW